MENSRDTRAYMFFVADQPFIKSKTILELCQIFRENPEKIIIPNVNGNNKNPVIFPSYLKEELMNIEGDQGGRIVIKNNLEKVLKVTFEYDREFFDIDTLDDYNRANDLFKGSKDNNFQE